MGNQENFDACTSAVYIKNYMDWQNCIEFEQLSCLFYLAGIDCTAALSVLPPGDLAPSAEEICNNCTLEAFYFDENNAKQLIQPLHSQAHIRLGKTLSLFDCFFFKSQHNSQFNAFFE